MQDSQETHTQMDITTFNNAHGQTKLTKRAEATENSPGQAARMPHERNIQRGSCKCSGSCNCSCNCSGSCHCNHDCDYNRDQICEREWSQL